jgi:hypothetical protein
VSHRHCTPSTHRSTITTWATSLAQRMPKTNRACSAPLPSVPLSSIPLHRAITPPSSSLSEITRVLTTSRSPGTHTRTDVNTVNMISFGAAYIRQHFLTLLLNIRPRYRSWPMVTRDARNASPVHVPSHMSGHLNSQATL